MKNLTLDALTKLNETKKNPVLRSMILNWDRNPEISIQIIHYDYDKVRMDKEIVNFFKQFEETRDIFAPTYSEIEEIIRLHQLYIVDGDTKNGKIADFSFLDLSGYDFSGLNLSFAIFKGTKLLETKFVGTKLVSSDFTMANATGAIFKNANLIDAIFDKTVASFSDFTNATMIVVSISKSYFDNTLLYGTNFEFACIDETTFENAKYNKEPKGFAMACPLKGRFIGYKMCGDKVVVLEIPDDAKRSSATDTICRCSKAKVLRIEELDGKPSDKTIVGADYDHTFVYEIGKIVEEPAFDDNRWNMHGEGIYFYMTKKLAKKHFHK